ncbi:hypothetical protein GOARA_078_00060 [Gordonia araii NBRC 100433]|uniref:N-acetyltransferase domain-containing protein n=1 Tax=Gordonia araii NBRC 100433 TaxID=1073574 RepID=G7H6T2_9ACTN|nr:GNAT family N-acetyltransferase [Gordonia araii]NNG95975.1 GNAT family N-acetyltransferase [Gordonia araii NBRC 100433]GAB11557.1 hypothetical protein GOARA_078_00060 [Gordonia araii NBRC 100433]
MSSPSVRPYTPDDRTELLTLAERAGEGSPTESLWGHTPSELDIYLNPYLDDEPESVFVAELDGALVGYLVGSLGTGRVASEDERMTAAIKRHRLFTKSGPRRFFLRASLDAAANAVRRKPSAGDLDDSRWPAHLHINVERRARGTGAAGELIEAFAQHAREARCPGIYLQTLVENERAARFFARHGFEPYGETPKVPGLRYQGKPVHQLTMVRTL